MRQVADPTAGPQVHRKVSDVFAVQKHAPVIGTRQTDENVKCGGLSRPVWSQQPNYFALMNIQADFINYFTPSVSFAQVGRLESQHAGSFLNPVLGQSA